jgi:hypothetical protein
MDIDAEGRTREGLSSRPFLRGVPSEELLTHASTLPAEGSACSGRIADPMSRWVAATVLRSQASAEKARISRFHTAVWTRGTEAGAYITCRGGSRARGGWGCPIGPTGAGFTSFHHREESNLHTCRASTHDAMAYWDSTQVVCDALDSYP